MSSQYDITQQFLNGGVIPADLVGQESVSKTYVDGKVGSQNAEIAVIAGLAATAQNTANVGVSAAGAAQSTATTAVGAAGVAQHTAETAQATVDTHKVSTKAHDSLSITYSGPVVGASSVKQAIDLTKQRVDNIVASGGESNIEIVDARQPATGIAFPVLGDRLNNVDTQLSDIAVNVRSFGAEGNYNPITGEGSDDTAAFTAALASSKNILVPPGFYKISGRLNTKTGMIINGAYKQSRIYFVTDNETLFMGSSGVDVDTSFDHCIIQNVDFYGLGKTANQIGLNISGYLSEMRGCTINGFKRGLIGRGVGLSLTDMYFVGNDIGLSLQDLIRPAGADYNTLIHLNKCTFVYNNLGMCNRGDGQTLNGGLRNVIDLSLDECIFELNTKGFDLVPFNGKMYSCWFENNTQRSTTRRFNWIILGNYYSTNGGDNSINFETDPAIGSAFNGTVDIGMGYGRVGARTIDFQNFDNSGLDISTRVMIEEKRTGVASAIGITDSVENTTRELSEYNHMTNNAGTSQLLFNKISRFTIKPDGTLYFKGGDIKHSGLIVTRLSAGKYKIIFNTIGFQGIPQAFATSPTSVTGDSDQDMYYCTTRMQATTGNSDYANFGTMNVMYINTYSRPGAGGADVLADSWVHVSLSHA